MGTALAWGQYLISITHLMMFLQQEEESYNGDDSTSPVAFPKKPIDELIDTFTQASHVEAMGIEEVRKQLRAEGLSIESETGRMRAKIEALVKSLNDDDCSCPRRLFQGEGRKFLPEGQEM